MIKAPPTPKGFRDILPELAKKRREVINTISEVLEESGFVPVETPTIEFADTLKGKYGEEEKLIYEFTDRGGRDLALRYDLTVPLARFVASNLNLIAKEPFRRYQIGQVFRGEKPQKGRWREFTQFDFDIVGSPAVEEDARIITAVSKCLEALGFKKYQIKVNTRELLFQKLKTNGVNENLWKKAVAIIDKVEKIGWSEMDNQLSSIGIPRDKVTSLNTDLSITQPIEQDPYLGELIKIAQNNGAKNIVQKLYLARGLDYYTGMIFEVEVEGYETSVAGGGRYDNLIGMFAKRQIPAVGGSFGLDRLIEAMK